ncbi:carbonyl reductase [NADPH] 1-like [Bos indicus x Bos taurus]|uniref:carbonyl reductase [NADPH] 1-like n=1 Tax=Bos indicus x Bos taurus TaxID=30522 RepID=UPI000F7D2D2E|nr:carbonyl reductase [NADPH] 1-like [Bos indicus x Bos taurus]
MNKFVEDTKNGVHRKEGWLDNNIYGVVKIGITALSRIQARKLSEQRGRDKILLNACCPGWVRTDMAGLKAPKSPEEGAPVYLALLPSDAKGRHGEFVSEKKLYNAELTHSSPMGPFISLSQIHQTDTYTVTNLPTQTKERKKNQSIPFKFSLGNGC